jgi:hypothetical protein
MIRQLVPAVVLFLGTFCAIAADDQEAARVEAKQRQAAAMAQEFAEAANAPDSGVSPDVAAAISLMAAALARSSSDSQNEIQTSFQPGQSAN